MKSMKHEEKKESPSMEARYHSRSFLKKAVSMAGKAPKQSKLKGGKA